MGIQRPDPREFPWEDADTCLGVQHISSLMPLVLARLDHQPPGESMGRPPIQPSTETMPLLVATLAEG